MMLRLLAVAVLLGLAAAPARSQTFVFHLRGDQEVPPVASAASGGCLGELDQGAATFDLTCVHDVAGPTVMHLHRGAAGVNGPAVFDLGDPASPVQATWSGMTPADIADLLAGDLYLNIHTSGRPDGEIRGQVLTDTVGLVNFTADGGQMVPPGASAAIATCSADLDGPATGLTVQCTHDVPDATAAHLHEGGAGLNGALVFTFPSPASPLAAVVPMTPLLVADFAATFLYLEIHTPTSESDPGDEIRGQIGTPPALPAVGTVRIVKRTFPAGGAGFGFTDDLPGGPAAFPLADGQTEEFAAVPAGIYTVTEDDPAVTPGGFALTEVACDDADSEGDPATRGATVRLQAAEVVTCTFTNVETAGADELFVFHLRGDQEVPPVPSGASGGCMGLLDSAAGELTLVCVHDVAAATVMHVHRAPAGANGPAVFDLGDPASPAHATWSGMTPADVADLFAGNLYVNIHTAGRPEGEIRGQILERTVDLVNFTAGGGQMVPPGATASTATCSADLDGPATFLAVQCTHDVPSPTDAHVHEAPAGVNGPVVFTFPSPASPLSGNVPMTPRLVADFAATFLYLEIHTPTSESIPGDEIRGQIGTPPAAPTTGTIQIVKRTFPPGGAGFGFTDDVPGSAGSFILDDGQSETFVDVPPGTYAVTEVDPGTTPGGFALTHVECADADSTGDRFARTATVRLEAGETVICTFENFQLAAGAQVFVFGLDGAQEVPPVPSPATGGCVGFLDAPAAQFTLVCTHDVVGATVMHVHRGAAGANGPIVFDLGDPASPVLATWTGMTPGDVADLLAGNLYINIHTSGRPGGEIRGQILERTHDTFAFGLEGAQQVPPVTTTARGRCFADLNDAANALFLECSHAVPDATAGHIHQAPFGFNGPVLIALGNPASPFSLTAPLSPRDVADLVAGFLYVNIHSAAAPDGEIRGQIVDGAGLSLLEIPALTPGGMVALGLALFLAAAAQLARQPRRAG